MTDVAKFEGDISTLVRQSAVAQSLFSAARQDVRDMEYGLNGRLDSVILELQKMSQKSREMSDTTATARVPERWATLDQSFEQVLPHVGHIGTEYSREREKTLTEVRRCNCAKITRRQAKSLWTSTWSLSWSDSATSHHLNSCQYWNPHQEVWTTKFSILHVNVLAAMALSASMRVSNQAGMFSISPSLALRGVVNELSPAFALLKDLRRSYGECSTTNFEKQTSFMTRSVLRLLKEGAVSPYEVDKNGRTLLHRAMSCACGSFMVEENSAFRELIKTLLDAGVAINEVDLAGATAFDHLISRIRFYERYDREGNPLCKFLANKGAEMSDVLLSSLDVDGLRVMVEMQNVAMLEPWQDVTQCGPLSLAILRRSEQDVVRILRAKPSNIDELNRRKQNPLHLACCWPRGIQLLLHAGANYLVHQADVCGWLPITYSAELGCLHAVQLLLDAGNALSWPGWSSDSDVLEIVESADTIPSFFLSTLQDRRRKLFQLAKQTLPAEVWADLDVPTDRLLDGRAAEIQRVLIDADIEIPASISVPRRPTTVYHHVDLTLKKADQLWDAGFRDIDTPDWTGCTPIMDGYISDHLEYAQWLLDHGADPHREICYIKDDDDDKRQVVMSLTALHCIAYNFFLERIVGDPSPTFEELLVESESRDSCHCACSSSGCTPFTILLKTLRGCHRRVGDKPSKFRRSLLQHLELPGHPASSVSVRSKVAEDLIRIETFEALRLSHTCCDRDGNTARRRYTTEEVQDMHEEYEELLSKHEDLVSEFCHKFQELGGTLTSFLNGYWRTRMDEVLEEGKPLDEEQRRRLREIGVVLEEASGESEDDSLDGDVDDEDVTDEDVTGEHEIFINRATVCFQLCRTNEL